MGIGFVILIHLVLIGILSGIFGFLSGILVYAKSKSQKKLKALKVATIPFVFFYSFYFLILIGSTIISIQKGVDIGIGDCWEVPLSKSCSLTFIDLPEQAYLYCGQESSMSDISHFNQKNNIVYGKTYDDKFFSFDLTTKVLKNYQTKDQFVNAEKINPDNFQSAINFYSQKKDEICGTETKFIAVLCLILSIVATIIHYKLFSKLTNWINFKFTKTIN